jgi:Ca2+-binding EF-hand superfamily protein
MKTQSKTVVKTTTTTTTQVVNKRQHQTSSSQSNSKQGSKPASKGPSAAPSQSQSKKVEVQKVIRSSEGGDDIKDAFELFDANDGKIDAREIKEAMQNIGFDDNNPTIYQVMAELDNPRNKNAGGASFSDFCQAVNYRVPEKESTEELRKVFNLFLDDPNSNTTSLESIKRVADEIGENIEELELNAMLNKASKAGARLTFDDFVAIMTGKDNA